MRRLRIAYLPANLNPGGAERQMLALAQRLPRDRFEAEFVVLSGSGLYDDRARAAGLRIRSAGQSPAPDANVPARIAHRASKALRYAAVVRAGHYDIVDAWLYPADVLAALMRPITRTPIIVTGRRNVDPQEFFGPLERRVEWLVGRLTDVVVANSEAAREHAVKVGRVDPVKLRVIRNGVVVGAPVSPGERIARRREVGVIDAHQVVVGCVANFRPVKRHELLLEAFAPLAAEGLAVTLVLIGDGPLRPAIELRIRELGLGGHVRLHGSSPNPEPLYAGFDLVVQASDREGLPNALLEGGAAGRPLIATAAGGSGEIVLDGQTGLLVPVGDRDGLTDALRRLVLDADLRDRMGRESRVHIENTFGMGRFVSDFATLYESLAEQKRRSP